MPIIKGLRKAGHPVTFTGSSLSYTLSQGASSGATGTADTLTFAPVGGNWPTATITISVSGVTATLANGSGGTLSGTVLTVPAGTATSCTVTMTPSTAGTATISATNSASMPNPGNLTYTVSSGSTASRLFASSFESGVSLATPRIVDTTDAWQDIVGTDPVTGYTWPASLWGGTSSLQLLTATASTSTAISNSIDTVTGHTGASTRALHLNILTSNGDSHTPILFQPASGQEPNDFYISTWIKYPSDLVSRLGVGGWTIGCPDWKAAGDFRSIVAVEIPGNSIPHWRLMWDNNANGGLPLQTFYSEYNDTIPVPLGQWFHVELSVHRNNTSGNVTYKINGQTLFNHTGDNIGINNNPIDRIFIADPYASGPMEMWVDDIEIWTGTPSNATSYTMAQSATTGATGTADTLTFTPVGGVWPTGTISISVSSGVSPALANGFGGTLSGTTLTVPAGTTTPCTVAMTPAAGGTATISATNSAGMSNPGNLTYTVSAPPGTVPNFTLAEWSGAASAPMARAGMAFAKGDIPSGFTPVIAGVSGAQFDQRTTWPDGSLKFAVAHLRDASNFTANQSRSYAVTPTSGTFSNTGSLTLAGVLSGHDFKVNFSSVQTFNDSSVHATLGSGAFTASLNTHIATATRITKVHSGPVCEGWVVWGMARDNTGGAADAHLKTYWHVDAWKNANGSVYALEVAAVVALDWWSIANKFRLDYNATFVDGATTINTYSGVQHPYHSWWITCRTTSDNNIGRRHWVGGAIPTLLYKPDRAYWIKSGLVCPLDISLNPDPLSVSLLAYTPCRAGPNGDDSTEQYTGYHRLAIDGTGGYMGRGLFPRSDAVAFVRQTALDTANARINAHSGLSVPYHFRSNRTRTRPGETADTASTICALNLQNPNRTAGWDDCTADGMPTPVDAYFYWRDVGGSNADGYVNPVGGTGVWVPGGDASHLPNFCSYTYMLEGENYHLEAAFDHIAYSVQQQPRDYACRGPLLSGDSAYASLSIPTGTYGAIPQLYKPTNQRATAFALNVLGYVAALTPADHVAYNYVQKWLAHVGDYITVSLQYMPASQKAYGGFYPSTWVDGEPGQGSYTPWFAALISMGAYSVFRMTGDTRYRDMGDCNCNLPIGIFASGRNYIADQYHVGDRPKAANWASGTNEFYAPGNAPAYNFVVQVTDHASGLLTQDLSEGYGQNQSGGWVTMTNGDQWSPSTANVQNSGWVVPPELTEGATYYVRDVTITNSVVPNVTATLRLANTPGGTAITFAANSTNFGVQWWPQDAVHTVTANPPYIIPGDSYAPMCQASIEMAKAVGNAAATTTLVNSVRTFMAPVNAASWMPWAFKAV